MADEKKNSSSSSSGGVGFLGLLTIVLLTLKVTGAANFSWFWVGAPFAFGAGAVVAFLVFLLFYFAYGQH